MQQGDFDAFDAYRTRIREKIATYQNTLQQYDDDPEVRSSLEGMGATREALFDLIRSNKDKLILLSAIECDFPITEDQLKTVLAGIGHEYKRVIINNAKLIKDQPSPTFKSENISKPNAGNGSVPVVEVMPVHLGCFAFMHELKKYCKRALHSRTVEHT